MIVGPNAVGKSSIFEAIRVAKAALFPRLQDELRNVLISLGATSAHYFQGPFQFDVGALAGDPGQSVRISLVVLFSPSEIDEIRQAKPLLARNLSSILLGRSLDDPQFDLRAYFSTTQGKAALEAATKEVDAAFDLLSADKPIELFVEITAQQIQSSSQVNNLFAGFLEQRLAPDRAIVSYFPADRSMPAGEVAIQIGPQDFKAQIDSHLAHAMNKYGRLKQTVVNQAVLARIEKRDLKREFDSIFETLLPGKEFIGLQQKPTGLVAVLVKDLQSNRVFDIDSLSSGEKGLILSFLLFRTASVPGSIILVDEPELHLNPAVCKKLIPYLADTIIKETDCQFLISTHSVEILRDAYEREDAQLFHLRNDRDISPVFLQDTDEVREAIDRLGVNTAQALTSKGTLFVEGETDVTLLEAAFPDVLSGILIQPLHGRPEVEKSIRELQSAEDKGLLKDPQAFLYDKDRKPSSLQSSKMVKVEQLQKYCIENYLIDEGSLFDLIRHHAKNPPESRGAFSKELKEIALQQLDDEVLTSQLNDYRNIRAGLKNDDLKKKDEDGVKKRRTPDEIADLQQERLISVHDQLRQLLESGNWKTQFLHQFSTKKAEAEPIWDGNPPIFSSRQKWS